MNINKNKWHNITMTYNGNKDTSKLKMYYDQKIDGIDYRICKQNGKIISKIPLTDITW